MTDDVFPDRSMSDIEKIEWMIETKGYGIVPVAAHTDLDPPLAGYSYSVGFTSAFEFPEIVVFGLQPVAASGLLHDLADLLRDGAQVPTGDVFTGLLDSGLRCALLPLHPPRPEFFSALSSWFGRDDVSVVQLTWPDRNGWLPWEPGFEQRLRYTQPLLGSFNDD
jgi:Domain of unknown function (DUF4262)